MAKIKVQNTEVTVITYNDKDYISLTDMVRNMENGVVPPVSTSAGIACPFLGRNGLSQQAA